MKRIIIALVIIIGIGILLKGLGQENVQTIRLPSNLHLSGPAAISPDYSKIAFVDEIGEEWFLNVISLKGQRIVNNLKLPIDLPFSFPPAAVIEWTPDSRKILIRAFMGREERYHRYSLLLVDIEKGTSQLINDIHPGCIAQSWNKESSAFLMIKYSEKTKKASFYIFHLGGKEEKLFDREGISVAPQINGMWDLESGNIYFWESGKGIYRIVPPGNRLEKIKELPPLAQPENHLFSWFHPVTGKIAYCYPPNEKVWRISIFDIRKNKNVKHIDTEWAAFPLIFSPNGRALFVPYELDEPLIWDLKNDTRRYLSCSLGSDEGFLDFRWGSDEKEGYLLTCAAKTVLTGAGTTKHEYLALKLHRFRFTFGK